MSEFAAIKLVPRVRETGSTTPARIGGYRKPLLAGMRTKGNITLSEIQALIAAAPHGHWRTTTFAAGLRSTGLVAPLVLDGPMNGSAFLAYVQQFLAPTLRRRGRDGQPRRQKVAGVEDAIRATGASLLYLPPYSPDLNPIESMCSPS